MGSQRADATERTPPYLGEWIAANELSAPQTANQDAWILAQTDCSGLLL